MAENKKTKRFMLLFLSQINLKKDDFSIVKSPSITKYDLEIDNQKLELNVMQTNESAVEYLIYSLNKHNKKLDDIVMLQTETVKTTLRNTIKQMCKLETDDKLLEITDDFINRNMDKTVLEIFKMNIDNFCDDKKCNHPEYIDIDFREKDTLEQSYKPIFDMVKEIRKLKGEDEAEIYIDLTGGLRHSTFLLLSVARLLQYSNIKVKGVFYSDYKNRRIENIIEIYDMYNVIAGAEEFANFGSVKTLASTYKNKIENNTEEFINIKDLLEKMEQFSNSLKLCKANDFIRCLEELKESITKFKNITDDIENRNEKEEQLWGILLEQIDKEYEGLFEEKVSIPEIIIWCVNKGLLQQSLTLCTELLPGYFVEQQIIYPKSDYLDAIKKNQKKDRCNHLDFNVYFVGNWLQKKWHHEDEISNKWDKTKYESKARVNLMLQNDKLEYDTNNKEKVVEALSEYYKLKNKRNATNHAGDKEEKKISSEKVKKSVEQISVEEEVKNLEEEIKTHMEYLLNW